MVFFLSYWFAAVVAGSVTFVASFYVVQSIGSRVTKRTATTIVTNAIAAGFTYTMLGQYAAKDSPYLLLASALLVLATALLGVLAGYLLRRALRSDEASPRRH